MIIPDNETEIDLLYYEAISKTVIDLLNSAGETPLTIGVHGDWGAGKSSILKMLAADFEDSDAEIVFLPEVDGVRLPEIWHRGDYELLSDGELRNQLEIFLAARESAYPILAEWLAKTKKPKTVIDDKRDDPAQMPLHLPMPDNSRG